MLWLDPFNRGESYLNADFLPQSNPGGGVHGPPKLLRGIMKRKILKGIATTKRVVMGIVSITFFLFCVVILLNHLNPV